MQRVGPKYLDVLVELLRCLGRLEVLGLACDGGRVLRTYREGASSFARFKTYIYLVTTEDYQTSYKLYWHDIRI